MKKISKAILGIILFLITMLGVLYGCLAYYYKDSFIFGTWFNGIYSTGMTVQEANAQLKTRTDYEGLKIISAAGEEMLLPEAVELHFDYEKALTEEKKKQNPLLWPVKFYEKLQGEALETATLVPEVVFDENALKKALLSLKAFQTESGRKKAKASIFMGEEGYELTLYNPEVLNVQKTEAVIKEALFLQKESVDLAEEGCYQEEALTEEMQKTCEVFELVDHFQNLTVIYVMGDTLERMSSKELAVLLDWDGKEFSMTKEGELAVKENAVKDWIDELADKYDTYQNHTFQTTDGETIVIKGGTYGNQIDRETESTWLKATLEEGRGFTKEPAYSHKARYQGLDDIGNTYIEVDMGSQMLYYYENGEIVLESSVVTGAMWGDRDTPEGVNFIYSKQKNRILRGADYESHVDYWMPVYKNIGIHDAKWRWKFGGEIYKKDGSHGCINMPLQKAGELYEKAKLGIPVIMFY